jgi:chorismate dehydratase
VATKISIVQYLNSVPLCWGMLEGAVQDAFDPVFSTPAECADQLASGHVDIGLIPSIEYQRIPGCRIIPGPAIASRNRVQSVILLSMVPLFRIRRIAFDRASRSSVALTQIILNKYYQTRPEFHAADPDPARMLATNDAALIIGDAALSYQAANLLPSAEGQKELIRDGAEPVYVFDLMERWNNLTGLPFVFAFWAARRDFGDKSVYALLAESRDFGLSNLDVIAERYATKMELEKDFVLSYLKRNVQYHMDSDAVEAIRLFHELAREVGAIKSVRGIEFL